MPHDAEVWQALLRVKGMTAQELASRLRTTLPELQALLEQSADGRARTEHVDRILALGEERPGTPPYALCVLSADGEIDLLSAGDTQPLFAERSFATEVAEGLSDAADVFAVPVWPDYAWRKLVGFHAAWGSDPESRSVFLVDELDPEVSIDEVLEELERGFRSTLQLRAAADDPARLRDVEARFAGIMETEGVEGRDESPLASEASPPEKVVDRLEAWLESADDRLN
jgi:hypothetical protein